MVDLVVSPSGVVKNAFLVFILGALAGAWVHSKLTHTEFLPVLSSPFVTPAPAPERPYYYYYE